MKHRLQKLWWKLPRVRYFLIKPSNNDHFSSRSSTRRSEEEMLQITVCEFFRKSIWIWAQMDFQSLFSVFMFCEGRESEEPEAQLKASERKKPPAANYLKLQRRLSITNYCWFHQPRRDGAINLDWSRPTEVPEVPDQKWADVQTPHSVLSKISERTRRTTKHEGKNPGSVDTNIYFFTFILLLQHPELCFTS